MAVFLLFCTFLKMTEKTHTLAVTKKARMTFLKGMLFRDGRPKAAVKVFFLFYYFFYLTDITEVW